MRIQIIFLYVVVGNETIIRSTKRNGDLQLTPTQFVVSKPFENSISQVLFTRFRFL
jgi:hypothetical protein